MSGKRRRHRRHRRHAEHQEKVERFKQKRQDGWDMNLYRNTQRKMIAGVCAGLADHFDVEDWVVRLCFVGLCMKPGDAPQQKRARTLLR